MSAPHKIHLSIVDRLLEKGVKVRVCDQDEFGEFESILGNQNDEDRWAFDEAILNHELECISHDARWLRLGARHTRIQKFIAAQRKSELAFENAAHDLVSEDYCDHHARIRVLSEVCRHLANQEQAASTVVQLSMLSDDLLPAAADRKIFSGSPINTEAPGALVRSTPRRPGAPNRPAA